jgi:hypothetical protein
MTGEKLNASLYRLFRSVRFLKLTVFVPSASYHIFESVNTVYGPGYVCEIRKDDYVVKLANWALAQGQSPTLYLAAEALRCTSLQSRTVMRYEHLTSYDASSDIAQLTDQSTMYLHHYVNTVLFRVHSLAHLFRQYTDHLASNQ